MTNTISIPDFCLVLMIGPSGCGKSTFAVKHFLPTEIVSSDFYRGVIADDETDQSATPDAFDVVHYIVEKRLKARRLTVVDATNVRPEDRAQLISIAKRYHALAIGFAFTVPEDICHERNKDRPNRDFGPHVVRNQTRLLRRSLKRINREGMRFVYRLSSPEEVNAVTIEREPLWTDKRQERGPFDIIGDIHGCATELEGLLEKLGYSVSISGDGADRRYDITAPEGRRVIFVGDLVDRGPRTPDVLRIAKAMVDGGTALCIAGNHENKLVRALNGRNVQVSHGLAESLAQLEQEPPEVVEELRTFMDGLISHYWLEDGNLVVAHAGIREEMQGRSSGKVRSFCMYGETTGETDEFGLPVRYNWAADYRGRAKVIYGHTPVAEAEWLNGTICIDTGCVFGGKLTALRYPELELVDVPAEKVYFEPAKPLVAEESKGEIANTRLNLSDVMGRQFITTSNGRRIGVSDAQSAAALETMSRFGVDPRWLIHLPPTMSPSETSARDGYLEHPEEALAYFRGQGVETVIAEEKHMGSRAITVLCRDEETVRKRFGLTTEDLGIVYSRTGRAFFPEKAQERAVLERLNAAMTDSGLWNALDSNWICLDAEIMPWSVKAQALLERQYAPVGAAAVAGLGAAHEVAQLAMGRGVELGAFAENLAARLDAATDYRAAYRPYVWPVEKLDDMRIAPFHILASEGAVHSDKPHLWHMEQCHRLAKADPDLLFGTQNRALKVDDEAAVRGLTKWWLDHTAQGGEGMVLKPADFVTRGEKGPVQPAVKCRGKEYLRIIYGPDYDLPDNLDRLRSRGLGKKRSLALREFALGMEALERFVKHEPLSRVHECVMAVLALESDPVDPRL